jgi:hypothetical protein
MELRDAKPLRLAYFALVFRSSDLTFGAPQNSSDSPSKAPQDVVCLRTNNTSDNVHAASMYTTGLIKVGTFYRWLKDEEGRRLMPHLCAKDKVKHALFPSPKQTVAGGVLVQPRQIDRIPYLELMRNKT